MMFMDKNMTVGLLSTIGFSFLLVLSVGDLSVFAQENDVITPAEQTAPAQMVYSTTPPSIITGEDRENIIQKIEDTLNKVKSLKAEFVQRGPQGDVDEGILYLVRPGKIRFQYNEGNPTLVVSNGSMLSFIDYEIKQVSRWPIDKTPLSVLVDNDISLNDKNIEIPEIIRFAGLIKLSVLQPDQKDQGYITLIFEESTMELKAWEVIDVQGYTTRIALLNPEYNLEIDEKNFTFEDPRPRNINRGPRR
jgi:outer membrane lipoprotein-sorting protein